MNISLSPATAAPGASVAVSGTGADPGSTGVISGGQAPVGYTAGANGTFSATIVAPASSASIKATENAQSATAALTVTGATKLTLGELTATIDADGKTVHARTHASPDVLNTTLDEPLGTKLTEQATAPDGSVVFPPIVLAPGLHTLVARGHDVPKGQAGGGVTNTPSVKVTIAGGPPPPPPPINWWGSGKKLFMVSPGWIGSLAWAQQNAIASKALGGSAMRSDITSMAQADYLVQACRESGIKLFGILGGSGAGLNPQLGIDVLAKYKGDLAGLELTNEPQTRISAPNYAALLHACVAPIIGKGVPICIGALNNSQGGSITPAARPWDWWSAVSVSYHDQFGAPVPGDILDWHWYLSWPGEDANLAAVEAAHGVPSRPQIISETGISTYTGVGSYNAQASGLVADIKAQLANPRIVGYGLFQPYDMHAGDGQFANNLGVMGKPAQAAVRAEADALRAAGVIV